MDVYDPVWKAFYIDEVLELIIQYAASGEMWCWTRNLRCVSKRWRSLSFKCLCQSVQLPKLCLRAKEIHRVDSFGNMSLSTFKKIFPTKCPRNLELSKPKLPFELGIQRFPTKAEMKYIIKMSSQIAAVSISRYSPAHNFPAPDNNTEMASNLQLPNLRRFYVSWQGATGDQPFLKLVNHFQRSSKRLVYVKYQYPKGYYREDWPNAPVNLTHISYPGTVDDIQKLTNGIEKTLTGLELNLLEKWHFSSQWDLASDCAILTEIAQRHNWKTLGILKISTITVTYLRQSLVVLFKEMETFMGFCWTLLSASAVFKIYSFI